MSFLFLPLGDVDVAAMRRYRDVSFPPPPSSRFATPHTDKHSTLTVACVWIPSTKHKLFCESQNSDSVSSQVLFQFSR